MNKIIKTVFALLFYLAVGFYIYFYIQKIDISILKDRPLDLRWMGAALIIGVAHKFLYPLIWRSILIGMGADIRSNRALIKSYATSWMGRYIPGKVSMIGARIYYAKLVGISKSQASLSFFIEMAIQILTGAILGLAALGISGSFSVLPDNYSFIFFLPVLLMIILYPSILNRIIKVLYTLLNRNYSTIIVSGRSLFKGMSINIIIQFIYSFYSYAIVISIIGNDPHPDYFIIWAAYTLSVIFGMLVPVAPAGLGARETIQLILLGLSLRPETAIVAVVTHRLMELTTDAIYFTVAMLQSPDSMLNREHNLSP